MNIETQPTSTMTKLNCTVVVPINLNNSKIAKNYTFQINSFVNLKEICKNRIPMNHIKQVELILILYQ